VLSQWLARFIWPLNPTHPPLLRLAIPVEQGQTLLIVEAMKVMNPIQAPRAARLRISWSPTVFP
jgi:hypothetical protein